MLRQSLRRSASRSASDWTLPLAVGGAQLGYLANHWHTHVFETPDSNVVINEYGPSIVKTTTTQATQVSVNWHSARFIIVPYTDQRIEVIDQLPLRTSTVKYLVWRTNDVCNL